MRKDSVCKERKRNSIDVLVRKAASSKETVVPVLGERENGGQCQENRSVLCLFAPFFTKRSEELQSDDLHNMDRKGARTEEKQWTTKHRIYRENNLL